MGGGGRHRGWGWYYIHPWNLPSLGPFQNCYYLYAGRYLFSSPHFYFFKFIFAGQVFSVTYTFIWLTCMCEFTLDPYGIGANLSCMPVIKWAGCVWSRDMHSSAYSPKHSSLLLFFHPLVVELSLKIYPVLNHRQTYKARLESKAARSNNLMSTFAFSFQSYRNMGSCLPDEHVVSGLREGAKRLY